MTATYTAITQELGPDLDLLTNNGYSLQVAKSVSSPGGAPSFNVVYGSSILGPNMSVSWSTIYGINWTAELPAAGAKVEYSGTWQKCSPGDSFDLNASGQWVANNSNPNADKNSLNIGSNGYQIPVHITVGVQNPKTQKWTVIWVAKNSLLKGAHGEYQPRQSVRLWFEEGTLTETMLSHQGTISQDCDMTTTPKMYFSYLTAVPKWAIPSPEPFF